MKIYTLQREQFLNATLEQAWEFFSSPSNLEKITPDHMRFKIVSALKEGPVYEGMKIEYTVSPFAGIPLRWVTLISEVNTPYRFRDIQVKGPYSLWEHTHSFAEFNGGIRMTDEVRYALPLGPLGRMAHALLVKKELNDIFNYRNSVVEKLF